MTDETPIRQPAKPSDAVQQLITALRSPLPEGFDWDFRRPSTCAYGLMSKLGLSFGALPSHHPLSAEQVDGLVPLYGVPARAVTPAMVADALERLIERKN